MTEEKQNKCLMCEWRKFAFLTIGIIVIGACFVSFLMNEGSIKRNEELVNQCNEQIKHCNEAIGICNRYKPGALSNYSGPLDFTYINSTMAQ